MSHIGHGADQLSQTRHQPDEPQSTKARTSSLAHSSCLFIPGKIEGGKSARLLLDSGASDNVISWAMFSTLPSRIRDRMYQDSVSASQADGRELIIYGTIVLNCRIRSAKPVEVTFRVANITEDGILGMAFFRDQNCRLILDEGILQMHGNDYQCTDEYGSMISTKIQVTRVITVPANSECQLTCRMTSQVASHVGLVENSKDTDHGICIATGIGTANKAGQVIVRCINPHNTPVTIRAGTTVGTFSSIEEEQIQEPTSSTHTRVHQIHADTWTSSTTPEHLQELYHRALPNCNSRAEQEALRQLLVKYSSVFSKGEDDIGLTHLAQHEIPLLPHSKPTRQPPRRLGIEKDKEVDRQVADMLRRDLIEPADSPYSAPVLLCKKKCGSWRLCIDYRQLNDITIKDAYPLPRIDDSLDALSGSTYFSTLDLLAGYHQIPMSQEAGDKAAFVTRGGLWRPKRLPFGLTSAPATFERLMEKVLQGLQWKALLLYLDDVIVFSTDFQSHLDRLAVVLERFHKANLKLKPSKCELLQPQVKFLGHIVSQEGVQTDPEKTKAVASWLAPKCQTEVRTFLGFVGYYRRFCPDFATVAKPLNKLTAKNAEFQWGPQEQQAFNQLKQFMIEAPILAYPDHKLPFILDTDASGEGAGGVLSQIQDGEERPIAYFSKTLSVSERNYCTTRRELLGVILSVKHFKPYLYGRRFLLRTDHASLQWLYRRKDPAHQVARWLEILSEFDFELQHRPGSCHENADGLSRCVECKQCNRIEKRDGGPTWDQVRHNDHMLQDSTAAFSAHHITTQHSSSCHMTPVRQPQFTDPLSTATASQSQGSETLVRNMDFTDDVAQQIPALQQTQGTELKLIYDAVKNGTNIPPQVIVLGSYELKKLAELQHLMKIDHNVLQIRIINNTRPSWVPICPTVLRPKVIERNHISHHSGINRTYKKIKLVTFWPGMTADIRRTIKACEKCQAAKTSRKTTNNNRQRLHSGRPMGTISIDLVGPMTPTPRGNKMILVISDHFTRWRDAIAIPDGTAETVATALDTRVFNYLGLPDRILSDQGTQFQGKLMHELCDLWGVTKLKTTAYNPQGNGVVERGNRDIGDALRCLLLERPDSDWDLVLPGIMRSLRATPHSTNDETPNMMMLGREVTLPDTLITGQHQPNQLRSQYVQDLLERMSTAHDFIRNKELELRTQDPKDEPRFVAGDMVWLVANRHKKNTCTKLQAKFFGPYKVIRAYDNNTYMIDQSGKHTRVNERRLKLHIPANQRWGAAPVLPEPARQPPRMGQNLHNNKAAPTQSKPQPENARDLNIINEPVHRVSNRPTGTNNSYLPIAELIVPGSVDETPQLLSGGGADNQINNSPAGISPNNSPTPTGISCSEPETQNPAPTGISCSEPETQNPAPTGISYSESETQNQAPKRISCSEPETQNSEKFTKSLQQEACGIESNNSAQLNNNQSETPQPEASVIVRPRRTVQLPLRLRDCDLNSLKAQISEAEEFKRAQLSIWKSYTAKPHTQHTRIHRIIMNYSNISETEATVKNDSLLDLSLTPSELPSFHKGSSTPVKTTGQGHTPATTSSMANTTIIRAPTPEPEPAAATHPHVHSDGTMRANPYIHNHTQMEVEQHIVQALKTRQCPLCPQQLTNGSGASKRHIWEHYVVYSCSCNYFTDSNTQLSRHQGTHHKGERRNTTRICKLGYHKASLQLQIPKNFPEATSTYKVQAGYHLYSAPQRVRASSPQPNTRVLGEHLPAQRDGTRISKRSRSPSPKRRRAASPSTRLHLHRLQQKITKHIEKRDKYLGKVKQEEVRLQAALMDLSDYMKSQK